MNKTTVESVARPIRHERVRRGSVDDQQKLRREILDAAFEIYGRDGLNALTMRAVASAVGLSAMALYRYFADKSELVQGLWDFVMKDVFADVSAAVDAAGASPSARLRACTEAAMTYWETHPDHFRLVFMTEQTLAPRKATSVTDLPSYHRVVDLSLGILEAWADELGGDRAGCLLARDLRMSMMVGYLHARLINRRYPWADQAALRAKTVDTIVDAARACLCPA
ncbi:TetR/AcrR family transcriptional regulator [Ideonella sp.]|uniref:TetR/AcrR family transcriptional regulator n=1 Tax=Ideonella sp. TaxID=1929293 RepID=UPI0035ADB791